MNLYDQLQALVKKYQKVDPSGEDIADDEDSMYAFLLSESLNEWDNMAWYLGNIVPKLRKK